MPSGQVYNLKTHSEGVKAVFPQTNIMNKLDYVRMFRQNYWQRKDQKRERLGTLAAGRKANESFAIMKTKSA